MDKPLSTRKNIAGFSASPTRSGLTRRSVGFYYASSQIFTSKQLVCPFNQPDGVNYERVYRRCAGVLLAPQRPMPEYDVDLSTVSSTDELIHAFNTGLFEYGGGYGQTLNLDAFNDYLHWLESEYQLTINGCNDCRVLNTFHEPSQRALRDVMLEIFADHPNIKLVLR